MQGLDGEGDIAAVGAVRRGHQQPVGLRRARQRGEPRRRRVVEGLEIVRDEDQHVVARDVEEPVAQRRLHAHPCLAVGLWHLHQAALREPEARAQRRRYVPQRPRVGGCRRERRRGHRSDEAQRELLRHRQGVAGRLRLDLQHHRPGEARLDRELAQHSRPSEARGALHDHGHRIARGGPRQRRRERRPLGAASHERRAAEVALQRARAGVRLEGRDDAEAIDDVRRGGRPGERIVTEKGLHQRVEGRRHGREVRAFELRRAARGRPRTLRPYRLEVGQRAGRKGVPARQEMVRQRAQRVEIRPLIELQAARRLGRDVRCGARHIGGLAERGHRPEVDELRAPVRQAPGVAGAHVAVHEPAGMNQREAGGDIAQDAAGLRPGQRRELRDVAALEQLHRVERPLRVRPVVVRLDEAGVPHARQRVVFALEERDVPGVRRPRQPLQRVAPPAHLVGHPPDRGHPALAEGVADPVPAGDEALRIGLHAPRPRGGRGAQEPTCPRPCSPRS